MKIVILNYDDDCKIIHHIQQSKEIIRENVPLLFIR